MIVFKSDRNVYGASEEVILILENNYEFQFPLMLSNSAPWKIFDLDIKEVFTLIALQAVNELRPGVVKYGCGIRKIIMGKMYYRSYIVLETINMDMIKFK